MEFWPHVWNLGRIGQKWAELGRIGQNLDFEAEGGGTEKEKKKEKEEEEEKIAHMCESIGHWPLRGRCPKGLSSVVNNVTPHSFTTFFFSQIQRHSFVSYKSFPLSIELSFHRQL